MLARHRPCRPLFPPPWGRGIICGRRIRENPHEGVGRKSMECLMRGSSSRSCLLACPVAIVPLPPRFACRGAGRCRSRRSLLRCPSSLPSPSSSYRPCVSSCLSWGETNAVARVVGLFLVRMRGVVVLVLPLASSCLSIGGAAFVSGLWIARFVYITRLRSAIL